MFLFSRNLGIPWPPTNDHHRDDITTVQPTHLAGFSVSWAFWGLGGGSIQTIHISQDSDRKKNTKPGRFQSALENHPRTWIRIVRITPMFFANFMAIGKGNKLKPQLNGLNNYMVINHLLVLGWSSKQPRSQPKKQWLRSHIVTTIREVPSPVQRYHIFRWLQFRIWDFTKRMDSGVLNSSSFSRKIYLAP